MPSNCCIWCRQIVAFGARQFIAVGAVNLFVVVVFLVSLNCFIWWRQIIAFGAVKLLHLVPVQLLHLVHCLHCCVWCRNSAQYQTPCQRSRTKKEVWHVFSHRVKQLGDKSIQNFLSGRYIVGYTVGNLVLRYTSQMKFLNMVIPILMYFCSLSSNWRVVSRIKPLVIQRNRT